MKEAKTIDEQIELMRSRNIEIPDEAKARESLLDIGYYRLGFFSFPFEKGFPFKKNRLLHRDHIIVDGTSFSDIVSLYYFDTDLRNLITPYLNRIEISLRTFLTYTTSVKYKKAPTWFVNPKYVNQTYIDKFDEKVYNRIKGNPVIKRHHKKYINDKYAPAWKTMEFMALGEILTLYNNIRDEVLKEEVARNYGCSVDAFCSYFETIRVLRNHCAHGTCIYNMSLPKGILGSGAAGAFNGNDRHNINGTIRVVKYILGKISQNRLNEFESKLTELLTTKRNENVNAAIRACGGLL